MKWKPIKNARGKPGKQKVIQKILAAMEARSYSQSAMHRMSIEAGQPIYQTKFSGWKNAKTDRVSPEYHYLPTIAQILRVPVAYLADDTRDVEPDIAKLELERHVHELIGRLGIQATYDRLTMTPQAVTPIVAVGGSAVTGEERDRQDDEVAAKRKVKKAGKSA